RPAIWPVPSVLTWVVLSAPICAAVSAPTPVELKPTSCVVDRPAMRAVDSDWICVLVSAFSSAGVSALNCVFDSALNCVPLKPVPPVAERAALCVELGAGRCGGVRVATGLEVRRGKPVVDSAGICALVSAAVCVVV